MKTCFSALQGREAERGGREGCERRAGRKCASVWRRVSGAPNKLHIGFLCCHGEAAGALKRSKQEAVGALGPSEDLRAG
jgi:hypothetical protein